MSRKEVKSYRENGLSYRFELESNIAALWLKLGGIQIESKGEENTYYTDDFNNEFFCKNYPNE